jgi:hypothetical protein
MLHDFIRLRYFSLRRPPSFVEVLKLAAPLRPYTFTKISMPEYLETISLQDWVISSTSFVASLDGRQQILSTSNFFATAFGAFYRSGAELPSSFFQSMLSAHLAIGKALMSSQPELLPPSWSAASPPTIASVNQSFSQFQPAFTSLSRSVSVYRHLLPNPPARPGASLYSGLGQLAGPRKLTATGIFRHGQDHPRPAQEQA